MTKDTEDPLATPGYRYGNHFRVLKDCKDHWMAI
jgi:hypothetical protein